MHVYRWDIVYCKIYPVCIYMRMTRKDAMQDAVGKVA